jgi:hypothetical protein
MPNVTERIRMNELTEVEQFHARSLVKSEGQWVFSKEKFAELIRADEREQCAKVCGRLAAQHFEGSYADECAMAIRARGSE